MLNPVIERIEEGPILEGAPVGIRLPLFSDLVVLGKVLVEVLLKLFVPDEPHPAVRAFEFDSLVEFSDGNDVLPIFEMVI